MPFTATVRSVVTVGGMSFQGNSAVREASGQISQQPTLSAGKAGTLTAASVATLGAGHGLITGDKVDVFWTGGRRYGVTATVAGNDLTLSLGAGDALPAVNTALVVAKPVTLDVDFAGDKLKALGAFCDRRAHLLLQSEAGANLLAIPLEAGVPYSWVSDQGVANPLAAVTVGKALMSCGDSAGGAALSLGVLYDSAS